MKRTRPEAAARTGRTLLDHARSLVGKRLARTTFIVVALGAAVWAVVSNGEQVSQAWASVGPGVLAGLLGLSLAHVAATMLSWRAVLRDLGSPLSVKQAGRLFFVSQIGKYLPGGVWNVVAAAEMAAAQRIPRRRTVSVMMVWWLVTVVTGVVVATAMAPLASTGLLRHFGWAVWLLPAFGVFLVPRVLNSILRGLLRAFRRPPLEHRLSGRGLALSSFWSLVSWVLVGLQVWVLATAVGLERSAHTLALCFGGYALSWVAGFLVVIAPAGAGVREVVLALALTGHLDSGEVTVVVLLSRLGITLADALWAVAALSPSRGPSQL